MMMSTPQAARTVERNLPISALRRSLSADSDFAADSTWVEAEPVSEAPRCTSTTLDETCWVPCAACCTLRETAEAMVDEISDSRSMGDEISLIALTDSFVAA